MIWLNDQLVDEGVTSILLPITDRSFLLGEGLFETILTVGGQAVALDRHIKRITNGAEVLGITAPTPEKIAIAVTELLHSTSDIALGRMRLTLSGSGNFLLTHQNYEEWREPAKLVTYPHPFNAKSPLQKVKSTSYGEYLLAFRYAKERNADDALLFNADDRVMESSTANVIALIGGKWVTPPLSAGPLPGITRELLMEWGLLTERELIFEELQRCESMALVSSLRSIQPIGEMNGRRYKTSGKIEEISTFYKKALAGKLNP
jgi:branched-chain amino acid aminotransferase